MSIQKGGKQGDRKRDKVQNWRYFYHRGEDKTRERPLSEHRWARIGFTRQRFEADCLRHLPVQLRTEDWRCLLANIEIALTAPHCSRCRNTPH